MPSKKPWYTVYALLLIILSAIGSSAIANSEVRVIFADATNVLEKVIGSLDNATKTSTEKPSDHLLLCSLP